MRMKPEIKARWVAALRSGEYRQGSRRIVIVRSHIKTFDLRVVEADK